MSRNRIQSDKVKMALNKFDEYHCAQSVVYAFSEDVAIDKNTLLALSTGFGVGFGRKQEVCGAVSGAVMILGAKYGRKDNESKDKTEKTYSEVQKFIDEFIKEKGTINCSELLSGCNLLTEDGQKQFKNEKKREVCKECVELACNILQKHFVEMDSQKNNLKELVKQRYSELALNSDALNSVAVAEQIPLHHQRRSLPS